MDCGGRGVDRRFRAIYPMSSGGGRWTTATGMRLSVTVQPRVRSGALGRLIHDVKDRGPSNRRLTGAKDHARTKLELLVRMSRARPIAGAPAET